jgi:hypothetical protein
MARVPRVTGRTVRLNPLPGPFQKFNTSADTFGINLEPALRNLAPLFKAGARGADTAPVTDPDTAQAGGDQAFDHFDIPDADEDLLFPLDGGAPDAVFPGEDSGNIRVPHLEGDMAVAANAYSWAEESFRATSRGAGGLYAQYADTLFGDGARPADVTARLAAEMEATGRSISSSLQDPRQRALFGQLWDRQRALELPRAQGLYPGPGGGVPGWRARPFLGWLGQVPR